MNYKVLITTSGTGSRLGEATKFINKALLRIGKKPAISHIIESYPKEVPIVITVGYLADQIKEFLPLAYPNRKFEFVEVKKYEGDGSSLGFSMLQAENNLQCPFVFHCCDTLVNEKIPEPEINWLGGYVVDKSKTDIDLSQYRTHKIINGKVVELKEKGDPDFESIHIGLIGINDYAVFWKTLNEIYSADPLNTSHSDVHVLDKMINSGINFSLIPYHDWYDTGTPTALNIARQALGGNFQILDKVDESIFIFDDFVIKFFANPKMVSDRVKRAEILKNLVPKIQGVTDHFYRYEYVEGDLYARVANPKNFLEFLEWANNNLWLKKEVKNRLEFNNACYNFYYTKTKERIGKFMTANSLLDSTNVINGEPVPTLEVILSKVNFKWLSETEPYNFHGDFILDNIIKIKNGYSLLDWRQDFGGMIEAGDKYYDLGKLNHNLSVNHDIINDNKFLIKIDGDKVSCDITRVENLVACQKILEKFVKDQGLDWKRVNIITGIIWLNMSPLHHYPFNLFLYYFGKLKLWKTLNQ